MKWKDGGQNKPDEETRAKAGCRPFQTCSSIDSVFVRGGGDWGMSTKKEVTPCAYRAYISQRVPTEIALDRKWT